MAQPSEMLPRAGAASAYSVGELMISCMASQLGDGDVVHAGYATPLAVLSAFLALELHAPTAVVLPISVSGVRRTKPFPLTLSMVEAMTMTGGLIDRTNDIYDHAESSEFDYEPLSPAQIDMFGNMNNSVIGDYQRPKVRLPGGGGIATLGSLKTYRVSMYSTKHSKRTFVEAVDFITGVGYLKGGDSRRQIGLPGGGPTRIVTDLGVLGFDEESGRMTLEAVHPHSSREEIEAHTGFELLVPDSVDTVPAPTVEELRLIRGKLDPFGLRELEFMDTVERRKRIIELIEQEEEYFLGGRAGPNRPASG